MKKYLKLCVLVLALAAVMMLPAFAGNVTVIPSGVDGAGLVVKDGTNEQQFTASYSNAINEGQYLVLMVKTDAEGNYTIDEDNPDDILYVDQVQASGTTVSFTLYPKIVTNSVVLLSSNKSDTVVLGTIKVAGVTVSGTVTSYLSETDDVTIRLMDGETEVAKQVVKGNSAEYSFSGVVAKDYTLEVSKEHHVTREYEIIVGAEAVTQDVKIHPVGDINGDGAIKNNDSTLLLRHIRGTSKLTDYAYDCADVSGEGSIKNNDSTLLLRHIRGTSALW